MAGNVMRVCQRCRREMPDYKYTNAICEDCVDELCSEIDIEEFQERCQKCGDYLPDDACDLCDVCEEELDEHWESLEEHE